MQLTYPVLADLKQKETNWTIEEYANDVTAFY